MIEEKKILAVIPARGGSKGVPRKNIRHVAGKPLIAWTIEEAKKSRYIDRLILSSEDEEIISVAREWGGDVPFVRPEELSRDETPGIEPILHAIRTLPGYDYVVVLQPTSPMRNVEDIDGCIEMCIKRGASACVSVVEPDKSPYWMFLLDPDDKMFPLIRESEMVLRRQDLLKVYSLNGAVYVADCSILLSSRVFISEGTVGYVMPKERSLDIDLEVDLVVAACLLQSPTFIGVGSK